MYTIPIGFNSKIGKRSKHKKSDDRLSLYIYIYLVSLVSRHLNRQCQTNYMSILLFKKRKTISKKDHRIPNDKQRQKRFTMTSLMNYFSFMIL